MSTTAHYRGLERLYLAAPTNARYRDLRLEIENGGATLRIEVTPDLHHAAGAVHGAHYFKLLDDSAFFAANSLVEEVFLLTAQFSIQLLRPIAEGTMRAEGRLVKRGRNLMFAESTLYGPGGQVLATGHGSFARSELQLESFATYRD